MIVVSGERRERAKEAAGRRFTPFSLSRTFAIRRVFSLTLSLSHLPHNCLSLSAVFLSSWPPPIAVDGIAVGPVPLARQYRGRAHARRTCFAHPFRPRARVLRCRRRRDSQTCVPLPRAPLPGRRFPDVGLTTRPRVARQSWRGGAGRGGAPQPWCSSSSVS